MYSNDEHKQSNEHDVNNKAVTGWNQMPSTPKNFLSSTHSAKVLHLGSTLVTVQGPAWKASAFPRETWTWKSWKMVPLLYVCWQNRQLYAVIYLGDCQTVGSGEHDIKTSAIVKAWGPKLPRNAVRFLPRFAHDSMTLLVSNGSTSKWIGCWYVFVYDLAHIELNK